MLGLVAVHAAAAEELLVGECVLLLAVLFVLLRCKRDVHIPGEPGRDFHVDRRGHRLSFFFHDEKSIITRYRSSSKKKIFEIL